MNDRTIKNLMMAVCFLTFVGLFYGCGSAMKAQMNIGGADSFSEGDSTFTTKVPTSSHSFDAGTNARGADSGEAQSGGMPNEAPDTTNAPPKGGGQWNAGQDSQKKLPNPEEGDLLHIEGHWLFHLNEYRGLMLFDLSDPKKPKKISILPIYGQPVEMFFNSQYAIILVRKVLSLTQRANPLSFERHYISQLVIVDLREYRHPRILRRFRLLGRLEKGLARQVGKTFYFLLHRQAFWRGETQDLFKNTKDFIYLHGLDLSDLEAIHLLPVITLAATKGQPEKRLKNLFLLSKAGYLLVTEVWEHLSLKAQPNPACVIAQKWTRSIVSLVDVSDPLHPKKRFHFELAGEIRDASHQRILLQKKHFYHVALLQEGQWDEALCRATTFGKIRLSVTPFSLDLPSKSLIQEIAPQKNRIMKVRFDDERRLLYFLTYLAGRKTLHAIDLKDFSSPNHQILFDSFPAELQLLQPLNSGHFLMALSNVVRCPNRALPKPFSSAVRLDLIDVRDLSNTRIVASRCVLPAGATSSNIRWESSEAHKKIAFFQREKRFFVSIPFNFFHRIKREKGWISKIQSAIEILSWKKDELAHYQQINGSLIQHVATISHDAGRVQFSILSNLGSSSGGTSSARYLLNFSKTHLAIVDFKLPERPQLLSLVELAPYINRVFRFGSYLVEQASLGASLRGYNQFRVKKISRRAPNESPILASFTVGAVQDVLKKDSQLIVFSKETEKDTSLFVEIYDLSLPVKPRLRSRLKVPTPKGFHFVRNSAGEGEPFSLLPAARTRTWIVVHGGLVALLRSSEDSSGEQSLLFLDLSHEKPTFSLQKLSNFQESFYLVSLSGEKFFVVNREFLRQGEELGQQVVFYRYFAQLWQYQRGRWSSSQQINLPGQLIQAYQKGEDIRLLTMDRQFRGKRLSEDRLHLLALPLHSEKATLLASYVFGERRLTSVLLDGIVLYVTTRASTSSSTFGSLRIFELRDDSFVSSFSSDLRLGSLVIKGLYQERLFLEIPHSGLLVLELQDTPRGLQFVPLAEKFSVAFSFQRIFVASGYHGLLQLDPQRRTIPIQ